MTWLDEPELQPAPEHIAAAGRAAITYAGPLMRAVMIASKELQADLEANPEDAVMTEAELDDQSEALEMIVRSLLGHDTDGEEPLSEDDWNRGLDWLFKQNGEPL